MYYFTIFIIHFGKRQTCIVYTYQQQEQQDYIKDTSSGLPGYTQKRGDRTLLEKSATWNPFCPVFRTLGKKGSQNGSLHVQEPKNVPYIKI